MWYDWLEEATGVTLEGLVHEEPLSAMIKTTVRACTGKPRRDLDTMRRGSFEMGLARHFPALVDRIILRQMLQLARQKRYENAPFASGMLRCRGIPQ